MSTTEWGLIAIAVSAALTLVKWFPRVRAVGMFLGICIVGLGGTFGGMVSKGGAEGAHLADSATASVTGTPTTIGGGLIVAVCAVIVIYALKSGQDKRSTTVLAAVIAILCVAGVTGIKAFDQAPSTVRQGVTNSQTVQSGRG